MTAILSIRLKSESMLAVLCFCGFCLLYGNAETHIENNYLYYLAAALTDLTIIYYLSKILKPTDIIISIQTICEAFIYINLYGFIVYWLDFEAIIYSTSCELIYLAALLSTLFQGGHGGHRNNNLHSNFYPYYHASKIVLRQNKKAIGN